MVSNKRRKKWNKKVHNNFPGLERKIDRAIREKVSKNMRLSPEQELEILKCMIRQIELQREVNKIKGMKNTENICFQVKKWITDRIEDYMEKEVQWVNKTTQIIRKQVQPALMV